MPTGICKRSGRKKGGGGKPKRYTELKRTLIEERMSEAYASFDFLVQIRDCPDESTQLRMEAANSILDRILGKPKEGLLVQIARKDVHVLQLDVSRLPTNLQWALSGFKLPAAITAGSPNTVVEGELVCPESASAEGRGQPASGSFSNSSELA